MKTIGYSVSSLFVSCLLAFFATGSLACELSVFEQSAADSPHGVTLAGAERIDEGVAYCRVEGEIANSDDGRSRFRFRLHLPDEADWNGRFLVLGNGGSAGMFQGENRAQVALQLGFATGQTDTGHTREGPEDWMMHLAADGNVVPNSVAIEDFGHRSIHLTSMEALLEAGADLEARDERGQTPLHLVAANSEIPPEPMADCGECGTSAGSLLRLMAPDLRERRVVVRIHAMLYCRFSPHQSTQLWEIP